MQEILFEPSTPFQRLGTTLGTTPVIVRARWNTRHASWYIDILETDQTPIVEGARISIGALIGRWSPHPVFSRGAIMARDTSRDQRDPGLDDLGSRVRVFYVEDALIAFPEAILS